MLSGVRRLDWGGDGCSDWLGGCDVVIGFV